jgi:hypothetical protein
VFVGRFCYLPSKVFAWGSMVLSELILCGFVSRGGGESGQEGFADCQGER